MKNKQIMDEQYHHYQVRKILRWIVLVLLFFVSNGFHFGFHSLFF